MDIFTTTITKSPEETAHLGEEFGSLIVKSHLPAEATHQALQAGKSKVKSEQDRGATTVCLYGDLGSGKTTFVQGVGKAFGIASRLLSPTFFIVRRYIIPQGPGFLYHIDLYRIEDEKELTDLGIPEILRDPDSMVLFEWAEKLGSWLPKRRIDIRFSILPDDTHRITIKKLT